MLVLEIRIESIVQQVTIQAVVGIEHVQNRKPNHLHNKSIKGERIFEMLQKIKAARGLPQRIKVYNEPEFISRALDALAYFNKVKLDYSRPGTPTDNPHIESFNGSFRDECLNMNWFMSPEDAKGKIERWRKDYNEFRPHSALTYLTSAEFARKSGSEAV